MTQRFLLLFFLKYTVRHKSSVQKPLIYTVHRQSRRLFIYIYLYLRERRLDLYTT